MRHLQNHVIIVPKNPDKAASEIKDGKSKSDNYQACKKEHIGPMHHAESFSGFFSG
jgi:hypothetical protein